MQDFKKFCPIENLMQEQAVLDAELRDFEPQLQKYENVKKNSASLCQSGIENKKGKRDCNEVQDFHTLVARTGN